MKQVPMLLGAILMIAGCHDLGAVGSMSAKVVAASSTWDDVGRELERSCGRNSQFDPGISCADEAAATKGIVAADLILRNYFDALADAANGQKLSVQDGIVALSGDIGKIPGIDAGKVSAVSSLAEFLAKAASAAAREITVSQLLARAQAARDLIAVLDRYVVAALTITLRAEKIQLRAKFGTYVEQSGGPLTPNFDAVCDAPGPRSPQFNGAGFLLATEYCRRVERIEAERLALAGYAKSLKTADSTLADLTSAKGRLGAKAMAKQLFTLGKELDGDVGAVRAAFGRN